ASFIAWACESNRRPQRVVAAACGFDGIALVEDDGVRNFHDPCFEELHLISAEGRENEEDDIGHLLDLDLTLADAHGFYKDVVKEAIEQAADREGGARYPAELQIGGLRAEVEAGLAHRKVR